METGQGFSASNRKGGSSWISRRLFPLILPSYASYAPPCFKGFSPRLRVSVVKIPDPCHPW
jgi:hypothetical protein